MPANAVTVTATWTAVPPPAATFRVTVNGSNAANSGTGNYTAGQTVTVRAGTLTGNTFSGWTTTSSGVTITNAASATTTFTMPANAVTVTATWTPVTPPSPPPGGGGGTVTPPGGGGGGTVTPPGGGGGGTVTPPGGGGGGTVTPPGGGNGEEIDDTNGGATPPEPYDPDTDNGNGDNNGNGSGVIVGPAIQDPPPPPEPPPGPPDTTTGNGRNTNSLETVRELFGDDHPVVTIGDMAIPLVGPRHISTWALLNLILLIAGVAFAAIATTKTIVQKSRGRRDREEDIMQYLREGRSFSEDELPKERRMSKLKVVSLIVVCVLAVCGIILFILTQEITRTMVFVDFWTLLHVLFVALQIVAYILLARKIKALVTFDGNAGRSAVKTKILAGEVLDEPKTPYRKGYIFDGWYTDSGLTEKWEFHRIVDRDTTLYAKWTPMPVQAPQQTEANPVPA